MSRPAKVTDDMIQEARQIVKEAKTARELRTGLSVLIPKAYGVTNSEAANVLGLGLATVVRMQQQIRNQVSGKVETKGSWGGRRRETMTIEEETDFLSSWVEKAASGGVLVVPPIQAALEERLGYSIARSTVYRMLARHGWRKVAPDTYHPKRDEQAQEDFKKTLPKRWEKLSTGTL
jgi:transposase